MNERRFVIIHNHVFKNAGSTIDWALHKNFGNDFVDHRDDKEMQKGSNYLKNYLKENINVRALSSHHLWLPLPELEGIKLFTIMMFRHPIERVTSVYNFERRQTQADTLGAKFARDHSLREYVLWRMRNDVPPTIRNFQTFRCLSGKINWQNPLDKEDLQKAKSYINALELLGFVEYFNESMILFENLLIDFFPSIDLSYKAQNVGQKIDEPTEIRIEKLRREIGESAFELLLDRNWVDLELYRYAKEKFLSRLSNIRNFDELFENFRKRCKRRFPKLNIFTSPYHGIAKKHNIL